MNNINKEKIEELKLSEKSFVIQFSASWCGPCRALTPILENVCEGHNIPVYKFDIAEDSEYAKQLKISSIPLVQFFQKGKLVTEKTGLVQRDYYEEQVELIKG